MKKAFSMSIILLIFNIIAICQNQRAYVDPRLYTIYSNSEIDNLVNNYPNKLKYYNWVVDSSYVISQIDIEKTNYIEKLLQFNPITKEVGNTVETIDETNINIHLFKYERQYDKPTTYSIGSSGKIITFLSVKELTNKYNTFNYEN